MSEVPTSVFVISAPSGAGKTSLCRRLVAEVEHLRFSTSHTTRAPREDEIDGADYHFIDKARFQAMIQDKQFAEWAQIHENYYGTAKSELTAAEEHGDDLLLDIEGQGAQQ
ncbi:guanylate kinase, partial [bacterium]|nr:guanylate kinase [bacterium]